MIIEIGTGIGKEGASFETGRTAAKQALDQISADQCDLVLVFSSAKFDFGELIKGIRSITGAAQLVGGTTHGEIFNEGKQTGSVIVMCMKSTVQIGAAFCKGLKADPLRTGVELAEQLIKDASIPAKGTMVLLTEGIGVNISALVRGIYDTTGAGVQILGGSFANDIQLEITYQFFNEEIFTDGVCGIYFPPEIQVGVGIKHGWFPMDELMVVTKSQDNILYELDNRPAADVYINKLNIAVDNVTQEALAEANDLNHPIGIFEFGGRYLIRHLFTLTSERGIICYGEIPQDSMVSLMGWTKETLINAAEEASREAESMIRAGAERKKVKAVLVFDCFCRLELLEDDIDQEIKAVQKIFGEETPIFGFFTNGEIGVLEGGPPRFHNKTVVVCAIGE
ncbi:MAG TPA: FIST N-terminal domain-containing protein [Bacillota bacterium]|nr:FIST N-terminal domain-containing protein [Bacillota bacterium]